MKNLFFLLLMLCCAWTAGAVQVTVSGTATDPSGAPLSGNLVIAYLNGDSSAFQVGYTDIDGTYLLSMEYNGTPTEAAALLFDNCGNVNTGSAVVSSDPATGYSAVIDFSNVQACTHPDCWINATYTVQSGNTVDFSAVAYSLDSNAVFTYTWDFGDGTTGTGENPSHTYTQQGTYVVTVTSTSAGCESTIELVVIVEDVVSVVVSGTLTTSNGLPEPLYPVDIYAEWASISVLTDQNGFYSATLNIPASLTTVQVGVFDYCSPATGGYSIVAAPVNNGQATADFVFCDSFPQPSDCGSYFYTTYNGPFEYSFEPFSYSATNSAVVSYNWDFGDGTTSTEQAPTHTYTAPGMYNVLLTTVTEDSCESHYCEAIFAFGDSIWCPIDTFYYGCQAMFWVNYGIVNDSTGNPLTMEFIDASFGSVVAWEWNFGDGTTSTQGPVVSHTYAQEGEYTVTLSTTTLDGCESTIEMVVYAGEFTWIEPDCQALFLPLPDSTGNGFFFLDMSIAPSAIQSWAWDFGDGATSTEQNPFHVYAQPGMYEVSLTISADSCNSIFSGYIDTDNPFNGMSNSSVLGLSSTTSKTNEPTAITSLTAYPNPVSDILAVRFESAVTGDASVSLRNSMGQLVRNSTIQVQKGLNAANVNTTTLTPGIYYLQVNTQGSVQSVKIIKA